jgi:excisionase family DNA binding protein
MEHKTLLLKPTEAAEELRISRPQVYRLIAAGDLPTVKVGKSNRIPREGLVQWIANQASDPTTR